MHKHLLNMMVFHAGQEVPKLPTLSCGKGAEDKDALFPTLFPEASITNHFPIEGIGLDGFCCDPVGLFIHSLDI